MSWTRPPARVKQYKGANPSAPRSPLPVVKQDPRAVLRVVTPKTPNRKQQAIRDSAKGEDCTVRIIGACNFDPTTTVWSHIPSLDGGRGMQMKSLDLAGCYSCSSCHDVVDGRKRLPPGATQESVQLDWHRGHMRSLVRLRQKGLV